MNTNIIKKDKVFTRLFVITLFFMLVLFPLANSTYGATTRSYSLVVTGDNLAYGDGDSSLGLPRIFEANSLFNRNFIRGFVYNTSRWGTTEGRYNQQITAAYSGSTNRDLCFFYHSGHGESGGFCLTKSRIYPYKKLLNRLSRVKCQHMVIFIQACYSGSIEKAWKNLDSKSKAKLSIFYSSTAKEKSRIYGNNLVSMYCMGLLSGFGSSGRPKADYDSDGIISITEIGTYLNSFVPWYAGLRNISQHSGYRSLNPLLPLYVKGSAIKLNTSSIKIKVAKSTSLKASLLGKKGTVKWSSSNPHIASVDKQGKVTGRKAGNAKITATVNGKKAVCFVKVIK